MNTPEPDRSLLNEAARLVPDELYMDYEGKEFYRILGFCMLGNSDIIGVEHYKLTVPSVTLVRPISAWTDEIELPNGERTTHFLRVT